MNKNKVLPCLVPRPHYCARLMRLGSHGPSESSCRSSRIRHRNALTEKAWEDAVQGLFRATVELTLVYGIFAWSLPKSLESKLDGTYNWMLRAVLNISWRQHPTKLQLHGPFPDISTILRELAIDLLLWSPNHGTRWVGRPAITYIDQLCRDAGCLPNDLPALLQDRDGRSDRLMNASASSTWWWKQLCTKFPFIFLNMDIACVVVNETAKRNTRKH